MKGREEQKERPSPLLPGCENLFVLQLLHPGGGGHRHGDDDIVYIEGALASPPLDRLLSGGQRRVYRKHRPGFADGFNDSGQRLITLQIWKKSGFRTGVLEMLWLPAPRGMAFSEDVESWRGRGL